MKERPIIFSTPMVQAILDGKKTMTRRVLTPHYTNILDDYSPDKIATECPYGKIGDLLWVRETFGFGPSAPCLRDYVLHFKAGGESDLVKRYKPSIHMPKKYARIWLKITGVMVERLQDITESDAMAEGIQRSNWKYSCEPYRNYNYPCMAPGRNYSTAVASFVSLWDSINKKGGYGWDKNPWVWVIEFERTDKSLSAKG